MLIEHDFEWGEDPGESAGPEDGAVTAGGPVPISAACPPDGSEEPSPEIVIIQRRRGFSPGVLVLAIVALVLSATTKLCKTRHPNAETIIHRKAIPPERPHEPADPGGRSIDGIDGARVQGRSDGDHPT